MIDLSKSQAASPLVHNLATDPGCLWNKDATVAIEAPLDADVNLLPEARWSPDATRTGVCGAVGPRVIALPDGGYRMYSSQILPRAGFPVGANDYDNATKLILSAFSVDGAFWIPELGVRLSPQAGGAGKFRVVSSKVVPVGEGGRLRMYYECCPSSHAVTHSIRSDGSLDGGLVWTL